jgi:hypothetical protein
MPKYVKMIELIPSVRRDEKTARPITKIASWGLITVFKKI